MSSGNILFMVVLVTGPIVSLSSSSWIMCWVGLELSFLGAIPMLLSDKEFSSLSKESVVKYFCIQALGSGLLMVSGVMYHMDNSFFWFWDFLFMSSLFMKLGVFPMHFWVPSVVAGLNWIPMFILLVWQKVAPFALLVNLVENSPWLMESVLAFGGVSALVGAAIGLNQTSVRAMLGSSSISHTGWSLVGVVFGHLWTYFLIYCASFSLLLLFFLVGENLMVGLGIMSLSGLPPFVMFIGKWSILKGFLYSSFSWLFIILPVFSALVSLFFYLKFFYSYYLSSLYTSKNNKYYGVSCAVYLILAGGVFLFVV